MRQGTDASTNGGWAAITFRAALAISSSVSTCSSASPMTPPPNSRANKSGAPHSSSYMSLSSRSNPLIRARNRLMTVVALAFTLLATIECFISLSTLRSVMTCTVTALKSRTFEWITLPTITPHVVTASLLLWEEKQLGSLRLPLGLVATGEGARGDMVDDRDLEDDRDTLEVADLVDVMDGDRGRDPVDVMDGLGDVRCATSPGLSNVRRATATSPGPNDVGCAILPGSLDLLDGP
mmetsp:Transcript_78504/g.206031  ORF Transcript_78504/g.206031 Transcript_78504/m.206031 type:complete len:237 (-) Transcript_78504:274-984(-)